MISRCMRTHGRSAAAAAAVVAGVTVVRPHASMA